MSDINQTNTYLFEGYRLDVQGKCLFDPRGEPVPLSHRSLDTLVELIRHRGKTLSKAYLMETVWPGVYVEENNLNQAITSIRKALGDSNKAGRFIKTFKGKGYCFVAEVTTASEKTSQTVAATPSVESSNFPVRRWLPAMAAALVVLVAGTTLWLSRAPQEAPDNDTLFRRNLAWQDIAVDSPPALPGSVAVLPLTTLNPDEENKVFALGMHMELIDRLSRVEGLKLISHNGVPASTVSELSLADVGQLLNVEYLVTGSILLLEDDAQINLYLLDASTGVILWTDHYQADTDNLTGSMPSRIALDIAGGMDIRVSDTNRLAVQESATSSFEAYRYQLASVSAFSAMDYAKAFSLSRQALELDPEYMEALHMFSRVNSVLVAAPLPGITSDEHIRLSLEAAEKSIQLAPDMPRGYIFKAVALSSSNQWRAAMQEVNKLRGMNVTPATLQFLAPILMSIGQFEEAVDILEANLREEPINLHDRGFLLEALEVSGNRMQARREYDLGEELNPEWWGDTVNVFLAMGRKESIRDIQGLMEISDDIKVLLESLNTGDLNTARRQLAAYDPVTRTGSVELVYYSAIAAYVGEHDLAVDLMSGAIDDIGLNIHWMWLPVFDETRKRDSFRQLVQRIGLADYWREYGWPPFCRPVNDSFNCQGGAYDLISMQ